MTLLPFRATLNLVCLMVVFCALLSGQQSSAPDNPPPEPRQQETQPPSAEQTMPPSQESGTHKATPAPAEPATSATPAPEQQNAKTQKSPSRDSKKTKTGPRKVSSKKRKPAGQSGSSANEGKVVVRNGGARDSSSQLTPGMTKEQQAHSRENTAQLLATTDSNLKSIAGRQLSDSQQSMLDQIHTYVRQSKAAADLGDLPRAHTLAYKAHLLSDELARK